MIIQIQLEDLEPEFIPYFRFRSISNLSLDYATNAIHGYLEGKEVIVFRFKEYGFIHDNRFNTQSISYGEAGITLDIRKTMDRVLSQEDRIKWFVANYYETGMELESLLVSMKDTNLDNFVWYDEKINIPKSSLEAARRIR
jgi:hypothetical protein